MATNKNKKKSLAPKRPDPRLLGEIRVDAQQTRPLGGLNPYNPFYAEIGSQFLGLFVDHIALTPQHRVLEIGCGTGRIAKPLAGFLDAGQYVGFDVNRYFVEWCRQNLAAPNCEFVHVDFANAEFNPTGALDAAIDPFPFPSASFHRICAIAVFNHLHPSCLQQYISEISRLLAPRGYFFGTFLLANKHAEHALEQGFASCTFEVRDPDAWYGYHDRPLFTVAHNELHLRRAFIKHGLMIKEPIRYGQWCGSHNAITGHDVVIARK